MEPRTSASDLKARLVEQRALLMGQLDAMGEGKPTDPDLARTGRLTRLDDLHNQAMRIEAVRRRKHMLARVDAALRRLDSGEYGECTVCGKAIAPARLTVDPAAELCIQCAIRAERVQR